MAGPSSSCPFFGFSDGVVLIAALIIVLLAIAVWWWVTGPLR